MERVSGHAHSENTDHTHFMRQLGESLEAEKRGFGGYHMASMTDSDVISTVSTSSHQTPKVELSKLNVTTETLRACKWWYFNLW